MVVTVDALSASENVAVGRTETGTPVAPPAGLDPVTVGGVVSGAAAVVNVQVASAASRLPAVSAMPVGPPRTRAVYWVEAVRAAVGVRVAVRVAAS